ncbi:MAG: CsgE family curli-type amyloid fiber assembly protein [Lutibacter sp.]|jgi:hypothetical protein|uniref:CsgE family curli-type amyloid fiber assembly protein n=1 Tax=Lutibacter sp. TaxID=1925666 RepID=UPI00299F4BC8|nr:CsgE family curli-type amyloid fiber assembly protein [Lutibacter sp.]MDX1830268.1 CsgE family curli-type amyloid fiber assembly protein [Lutibacter sp.]
MFNKLLKILFFVIVIGSFNNSFSQQEENGVKAKIVAKSIDNLVDIKAVALNEDLTFKDEYTYLLFSLKKGAEGNYSKNTQSGVFSLEANEQKILSSLKINLQKDQEIKVYLFIRKNGELISKDSVIYTTAEKTKTKISKEEDFTIKGIVVDNVITKMGKDFYDYFYQAYLVSGIKYGFVIKINEKPYLGRSSIITVYVKDFKINEFYSRPNEEYLKSMVKLTLQRLSLFNKQQKMLNKTGRI